MLKVSAVTWSEFDETESKTCKDKRRINPAIQVRVGDFLFSRANTIELVGACVIVKQISSRLMLSDKTLRLHLLEHQSIIRSLRAEKFNGRAELKAWRRETRTLCVTLGRAESGRLWFRFPPLAEQEEIVRRVDTLFKLADHIEARYDKAKAHVEKVTPSLLAKGHSGGARHDRGRTRAAGETCSGPAAQHYSREYSANVRRATPARARRKAESRPFNGRGRRKELHSKQRFQSQKSGKRRTA